MPDEKDPELEDDNPFAASDDADEEFSIDQLSEAYAKILKEQQGDADPTESSSESEDEDSAPPENDDRST